jgi:Right handed beta helix region
MLLESKEIGPEANFCAEINALQPGDELVLRGGKYKGPCTIHRGGSPDAPIIIRAQNSSDPPWIAYDGRSTNVVNIRADHVTVRGFKIGPTQKGVDGVRIYGRRGIAVEDCQFSGLGGIAVVANHNSGWGYIVRRNIITNTNATAIYFGCHDGSECKISDLLIENNFISGVSAPEPEVGYGIQVKLNSTAVVRDNVIIRTKGPPIMVYGSHDADAVNIIERNFVAESRSSSGIVVGGGPAQVWNNISVQNGEAGIAIEDYGGRGLLRKITIEHNTIHNNNQAGILIRSQREVDAIIFKNALAARAGTPLLAATQNRLKMVGNWDCSANNCFRKPDAYDFTPKTNSPLITTRFDKRHGSSTDRDYFGSRRPPNAAIGAVEPPGGIVELAIKP